MSDSEMSDDDHFQHPHVQTPPESTIIMPDGWTFKPVSAAILNGDCLQISASRRNTDAVYSRLVKGDDAKYGDPNADRDSRLDLTIAFINSRSFHEYSSLPDDVLTCPKIAKATVMIRCNWYASLPIVMRSNPDVIMALVESVANGTHVRDGIISLIPPKCGETRELLSAIVDVVQKRNDSLAFSQLSRIWKHLFKSGQSNSDQAMDLFARLDWFHPVMMKAVLMMSKGVGAFDCLKQTHKLFDTAGLQVSEEVSTAFQKTRYELIFEFLAAERATYDGREVVGLCKGDTPFLCYLAFHRPHLLGHCLEVTTSLADRLKILDVTFSRTARVNDAEFAHIESVFPSAKVPIRENKLGDFVDVVVSIASNPSMADHLAMWAKVDNFGAFLSKFSVSYHTIDSYRRRWYITRTNTWPLNSFHWGMLPSAWSQNEEFVRMLLVKVDPELGDKIIDTYRAEKNAVAPPPGLFNILTTSMLDSNRSSSPLKPDQEVPTVVSTALYSGSKDMFPWENKAMVALFSDPKFEFLDNASRQFFARKNTVTTMFTLALIAFADDIETCKSIIKENKLEISGGDLLSLIPESTLREIRGDREFFKSLFETYIGIGPLLPTAFRYDDEFVIKTIDLHPQFFRQYDSATVLKSSKVVDAALSNKETVEWIFHQLPLTDRENVRLVREVMKNESLPLAARRSVYTNSVPGVVKMQGWCKKLASQLFGCHILRDDRVDDPVISKLANIAHDSHSSYESNRGTNTAYLRSLYTDIQIAFMPVQIAKELKIHAPVPDKMKTYIQVLPNNLMLEQNRLEKLTHAELKSRHEYLEEIADTACQILEPRRRDGRYPSAHYCEHFEGVTVKFSYETDIAGERVRALRTMSGKRIVRIPSAWKYELDSMPADADGFWGKLHAGYGQRQKATLLKNGTLGLVSDDASDEVNAAALAKWAGVSIKVYGTFSHDNPVSNIFPERSTTAFPSFVEMVEPSRAYGCDEETAIVELHRASVAKGGLGVVFRDDEHPEKLITLEAQGYSTYVQKIVDFLHKYPLNVLSTYMHDFEVDSDDEDPHQDMADAVEEEEIGAKFNATAVKVAAILAPPPPPPTARSNGSRPTKKRRLTQADVTPSPVVSEQPAFQAEVQAPVAPTGPVSVAAAAAALYWQEEDDDDDDAAVSEADASCMDDDGDSEIDDSSDAMEDDDGDDE
jgi:hypothetical protein